MYGYHEAEALGMNIAALMPTGTDVILDDLRAVQQGEGSSSREVLRRTKVFENLVGNAMKFTSAGSISVGAAPMDNEVAFWVADTGSGIAVEHMPHLSIASGRRVMPAAPARGWVWRS